MNKLGFALGMVLLSAMAGACARSNLAAPGPAIPAGNKILNPGDRIGHLLIVADEGEDVMRLAWLDCLSERKSNTTACGLPVGAKVNVGLAVDGDSPARGALSLDDYWSARTQLMTINGRPVNLGAFGALDLDDAVVGAVRMWNVVITADAPETVTVRSAGQLGGDGFRLTTIIRFTQP